MNLMLKVELRVFAQMENINLGYVSLGVVGALFFGLQIWWIGMTIGNGQEKRVLMKRNDNEEIKKNLEKLWSKSS